MKSIRKAKEGKECTRLINHLKRIAGPKEVLQRVENSWREIPYVAEEVRFSRGTHQWETGLTGIILPDYDYPGTNVTISSVFYALLKHLDINKDEPEPCGFRTLRRKSKIPYFVTESLQDGNYKARKTIDGYLQYQEGIQKALVEIARLHPIGYYADGGRGKQLIKTFRERFDLEFIPNQD